MGARQKGLVVVSQKMIGRGQAEEIMEDLHCFIRDHTVVFSQNQFEFLPSFMEGQGQIHPFVSEKM